MVLTVLKTKIVKKRKKEMIYRDYKHFDEDQLKNDLAVRISECPISYSSFE